MATDPNLWRTLRVGDYIRFVEYPREFLQPGYSVHPETEDVYKRLLERCTPSRVWLIDEYNAPWIACRFRQANGRYEQHTLKVDHDGFVKVEPPKKRRR